MKSVGHTQRKRRSPVLIFCLYASKNRSHNDQPWAKIRCTQGSTIRWPSRRRIGVVADVRDTGIAGPSVGFRCCPGSDVGLDESVQADTQKAAIAARGTRQGVVPTMGYGRAQPSPAPSGL
jgi:hypothetical protein